MKYRPACSAETVEEPDYLKTIIFSSEDFDEKGHLLQVVTIPPRTRQRLHLHRQQTEVFYVLEGEAVIHLSGEDLLAEPGDAFVCAAGDKHSLWNQSERDFRVLVFKISKPDEEDTDWLEGEGS